MAVTVFNISGGTVNVKAVTAIEPAQEIQTVAVGKDTRLALRVSNGNAAGIIVRVKAGDGPRAPLGDNDVPVAANAEGYIALYDTARYKSGNVITVVLVDSAGTALDSESLGAVQIEAVQL